MINSQKQSAVDGSTAIQATGDVTVNNGITTAQMGEILSHLSTHVNTLAIGTRDEIERRLKRFEESVLERLASDPTTRPDAFREPDFLAATLEAQRAYARSGDDGLRQVLVDLVALRSKIAERSRLSLTLNDAIAKVASIPEPDLNAMSLIFLFQNVQHNGIGNMKGLADFLSASATPLLSSISLTDSASGYLAAHGCIVPPSGIASRLDALEILWQRYGVIISKGAPEADLRDVFPDYDRLVAIGLIVESPYGHNLKTFSLVGSALESQLPLHGIYGEYSSRYKEMVKGAKPTEDEFVRAISPYFPKIGDLLEKYNIDMIRNSTLTSVGIALAHANMKSDPLRNADLSIWITP